MSDHDQTPDNQPFFFDEFFGSDEEGIEITVMIRGRAVPLRLRRGLTLREKAEAESRAIKRHHDPKTGRVVIDSMDEAGAAEEIAFKMLLHWPFVNRADGSPVPITRENVRNLLGGLEQIIEITRRLEEYGEKALGPFAPASDDPSALRPVSE